MPIVSKGEIYTLDFSLWEVTIFFRALLGEPEPYVGEVDSLVVFYFLLSIFSWSIIF